MSKPSPSRHFLTLARRAAEFSTEVAVAVAGIAPGDPHAAPTDQDRGHSATLAARKLAALLEQLAVDAEIGLIRLRGRPAGPELPIIAAIEARAATHRSPANAKADPDWRSRPIEGIGPRLRKLCEDSGIATAGQAWDQLESGTLSPEFWTHREAKQLESAIAAMRAAAGDPAPFTQPVELPDLNTPIVNDGNRERFAEAAREARGGPKIRRCRSCKCTEDDCRQCIEKTGEPCHWVEADLCSACWAGPIALTEPVDLLDLDAPGGPRWKTGEPAAAEVLITFELVEKPRQKAPGHVQFRAVDQDAADRHARVNWPGLVARPVPPGRELADRKGSDGRPKSPAKGRGEARP